MLRTALAEVIAVLNDRPLTYISEDHIDIPITPNDFLKSRFTRLNDVTPEGPLTITASHLIHK